MIKIGYELAFMWLGEAYLDCAGAARLRALMFASDDDLLALVDPRIELGVQDPLTVWGETPLDHVAFAFREHGKFILALRVFDVMSACMTVAEAEELPMFQGWHGRYVSINPATGSTREVPFMTAVEELVASGKRTGV